MVEIYIDTALFNKNLFWETFHPPQTNNLIIISSGRITIYMGMMIGLQAYDLGLILIVAGFLLLFIGVILMFRGRGRGGGIILIGPFPIVWGSDKEALKWVVILFILMFIFYIIISIMFEWV